MPQFRNLSDIQAYLEENTRQVAEEYAEVERVLVDAMVEAVKTIVYDAYTPGQTGTKNPYARRGEAGGLQDPRGMAITDVIIADGKVQVVFENLNYGADSLRGEYLVDTIVEGIQENWNNPNGPWSEPRDFISETRDILTNQPRDLILAIRAGLKEQGFKVK